MKTRYSFGGDEHIFAEIDETMSLQAFFKSLSITSAVRESRIAGVTEICPANASFQIKFDPDKISPADMLAELTRLESAADKAASVIKTRIIEIPVLYNDPWTHETLMRFRERHQDPTATDLEYAARVNNLGTVDNFVKAHSGAPHMAAYAAKTREHIVSRVIHVLQLANGEILNRAASLVEVAQGQLKILLAGMRAER
jgi:urea carboxylase